MLGAMRLVHFDLDVDLFCEIHVSVRTDESNDLEFRPDL